MPCSQISGNLLSEYLAGTLSPMERARIESHLFSCADCRAVLAEPNDAPPPGITGVRPTDQNRENVPPPDAVRERPNIRLSARNLAVLVAAGLLAALVAYRQTAVHPPQENESRMETAQASSGNSLAPEQALGPNAQSGQQAYTNEALHSFLEDEKKRMGIRAIVPPARPEAESEEEPATKQPLEREQAREAIRNMADQFAQINQYKQSKLAPTVPVAGSTPHLLNRGADSHPLDGGSTSALNPKGRSADPGSVALAADKESVDVSMPATSEVGAGKPVATGRSRKKALHGKTRILAQGDWKASWSGRTNAVRGPGGAVIQKTAYWADLWHKLGLTQAMPDVDFNRDMVIGVFGGVSDPASASVQVVSVAEEEGRLLIRYRNISGKFDPDAGPLTAYHAVIIPRSTLPPSFEQVP